MKTKIEDEEKEFGEWVESAVIVDKEGVPLVPELIDDKDMGEDGDEK